MRVYLCIYSIYNYEHNILTNFAKKKEKRIKLKEKNEKYINDTLQQRQRYS